MKKTVTAILTLIILISTFASCADNSAIAMEYEKASISERIYYYWLTQYKSYFMYSMEGAEDTDEFWDSEVTDGVTAEEYVREIAEANIKKNVICLGLFDKYGLSLSDSALASVEADLADLEYSYSSRSEMNADLANYGINYDILHEIYLMQEKISAVFEYLYGENGMFKPTADELDSYYKEHYARIKYITLKLFMTKQNDDGTTATLPLSDEDIEAKRALADSLTAQLKSGADFDSLFYEYTDDLLAGYENGVYISTNNIGYEIIDRALEMSIGDTVKIEQPSVIYVVKRYELEERPYNNDAAGQFDALNGYCSDEIFQNMLNKSAPDVTVYNKVTEKYSIRAAAYGSY